MLLKRNDVECVEGEIWMEKSLTLMSLYIIRD